MALGRDLNALRRGPSKKEKPHVGRGWVSPVRGSWCCCPVWIPQSRKPPGDRGCSKRSGRTSPGRWPTGHQGKATTEQQHQRPSTWGLEKPALHAAASPPTLGSSCVSVLPLGQCFDPRLWRWRADSPCVAARLSFVRHALAGVESRRRHLYCKNLHRPAPGWH